MRLESETPQSRAARQFMAHKGLAEVEPVREEKLEGQSCWYYEYDLPEGKLELEVFWNGRSWETTVVTFTLAG